MGELAELLSVVGDRNYTSGVIASVVNWNLEKVGIGKLDLEGISQDFSKEISSINQFETNYLHIYVTDIKYG